MFKKYGSTARFDTFVEGLNKLQNSTTFKERLDFWLTLLNESEEEVRVGREGAKDINL